jgi:protein arginine kinase activator
MTRTEFKKNGRLGCPDCYKAFMGELGALTKAMHHSSQHTGKIPACQGQHARLIARLAALQKDIETAISKEEYEVAAQLRDEIQNLRQEANRLKEAGREA